MKLEHGFTVPVPVERAWDVLLDLPTVAPCMPGASLTSHEGDEFTGTVKVKVGPINLTYQGQGRIVSRDEVARRAVIEASGKESRGGGTAKASVTAELRPDGDGTRVDVTTDLNITGRPAQFGRGMVADVGNKLIGQFAECLSRKLGEGELAPAATGAPATPSAVGQQVAERSAVGQEAATGAGAASTPPVAPEPTAGPTAALHVVRPDSGTSEAAVRDEREVEPIDLLEVTGAADLAKRAATYAVAFAAGVLLGWLISRSGGD